MEAVLQSQQHQAQQQQQVSFHFWNCQLTSASPKYSWDPENWSSGQLGKPNERRHRLTGRHGNGDVDADAKAEAEKSITGADGVEKTKENGSNGKTEASARSGADKNGDANANVDTNGDANGEDVCDEALDTDYMQHILKVNACILGPKATGIHLITVRTRCYQSEPDSCPLVCIDPACQRTLALGFEFVLDSQNEVTFELVEGAGPVWLTGLHQVRVHDDGGVEHADADDEEAEEVGEEADGSDNESCLIDESSRFRLAATDIADEEEDDGNEEEMQDDDEEDDEEEDDDEEDDDDAKQPKPELCKRSPITTAQLRSRKRLRLADGDDDQSEEKAPSASANQSS